MLKYEIRSLFAVLIAGASAPPASAQTFVQVSDLGGIGPRLTRSVTQQANRNLFAILQDATVFVDGLSDPAVGYTFAADPMWHRIVFGNIETYARAFGGNVNEEPLLGLTSVDVSGRRNLFAAALLNNRVIVASFDLGAGSLTFRGQVSEPGLYGSARAVAWDGASTPLLSEYFYVLDQGGSVSYWVWQSTFAEHRWTFRRRSCFGSRSAGLSAGYVRGARSRR